ARPWAVECDPFGVGGGSAYDGAAWATLFKTDPRVADAELVARPQAVLGHPLSGHERAAGAVAVRQHGTLVAQHHLAVQHGDVRVFQARGCAVVPADQAHLLGLEGKDAAAILD